MVADPSLGYGDDDGLLPRALAEDAAGAQRQVFDNSLRLGDGFRRFHDTAVELDELPAVLAQMAGEGAPCLRGDWRPTPGEAGLTLERGGCPMSAGGPSACDWWRDAISGLVLGVTGGVRHTRHHSRGHGGDRCLDVFHVDPESPLRFGPIPAELSDQLAEVTRTAAIFDPSCTVEFLGLSEGILYYQLATAGCGGGVSARPTVERSLQRRFPWLSVREVSPRPVLDDP